MVDNPLLCEFRARRWHVALSASLEAMLPKFYRLTREGGFVVRFFRDANGARMLWNFRLEPAQRLLQDDVFGK